MTSRHFGPCEDWMVMKAIRFDRYGSPDVLELRDVEVPAVGDDELLVRVRAASVNPLDWHFMRGLPYLVRLLAGLSTPKASARKLGADMAGSVEAVGKNVTEFKPGDEVFGGLEERGTLAEYITISQAAAVLSKPASLTFEQAAGVSVAGCTALQALRDKGRIQPGYKVLVNGASGGVGPFAIQIAKALGGQVTGVCSTKNTAMVAKIGADSVIDYTRDDFTQTERHYDLLLDIAGNRTLSDTRRVLRPRGTLVCVGGPNKGNWIGPMSRTVKMAMLGPAVSQRMVSFLAHQTKADLTLLRELIETGKVRPVIDRAYPLDQAADALRYLEEGHATGKVIVTI
jgi:NADPH:quinone reductase-like Zn-dependent oxidoreductase